MSNGLVKTFNKVFLSGPFSHENVSSQFPWSIIGRRHVIRSARQKAQYDSKPVFFFSVGATFAKIDKINVTEV